MPCECEDPFLCQSIPHTSGSVRLAYSKDPPKWKYYNFSEITEIALYFSISELTPEMLCMAHKNNVQLYLAGRFGPQTFINHIRREEWIEKHLRMIRDNYLDGITIDYEKGRNHKTEPLLISFVAELARRLRRMGPNYIITFTEPFTPFHNYDLRTIPKIVDYLMIMSYDEVHLYPAANQQAWRTVRGE